MHDVLVFLQKWSPHIWLFGSLFGVPLSATLLVRAYRQRVVLAATDRAAISRFWFRHGVWFFTLHVGYTIIGLLSVAKVQSDWASLFTLVFLVATPLVLVYRSFDSLRLEYRARHSGGP